MEYEGSMMYDRYPDRLMLEMLCRKIYRELNPDHIDERDGSGRGTLFSSDPGDADAGNVSKKMQALSVSEMVLGLV